MPPPRRGKFSICTSAIPRNIHKCVVVPYSLDFDAADRSEDGFDSLNDAMTALRFPRGNNKAMEDLVESHSMFPAAKKEYLELLDVFLPGFQLEDDSEPEKDAFSTEVEDEELTDALKTFIALTRRRKEKAEEFYVIVSL
jgi:hypothetical protein